jgi:hypothetical protein
VRRKDATDKLINFIFIKSLFAKVLPYPRKDAIAGQVNLFILGLLEQLGQAQAVYFINSSGKFGPSFRFVDLLLYFIITQKYCPWDQSEDPKRSRKMQKNHPQISAIRDVITQSGYGPGDVMVVFGEIFSRGYANGILDEAQKAGMKIIRSTVGRRTSEGELRDLTPEELAPMTQPLINIALEAGFDLEKSSAGLSPCDQLAGVKMSEWDKVKLDWTQIHDSQARAEKRFHVQLEKYFKELEKHIPNGKNVLFVHTMAGGVPRAKILMPTMNKIFKGQGDRHISSELFAHTELGKFSAINFDEVTANTFKHLIDHSTPIRQKVESDGKQVSYVAYGYHGTEVLVENEFQWQTYSPYFQGWAKMRLEAHSIEASKKGIKTCVYNCPEILTNSSSIFLGVEVSLYPLLGALLRENGPHAQVVLKKCQALLKDEYTVEDVLKFCDSYLTSDVIREHCDFEKWPQHNSQAQMEKMLQASAHLWSMHKNEKELITFILSEEIFMSTGYLMLRDSFAPQNPVTWLNHDVLAKVIANRV